MRKNPPTAFLFVIARILPVGPTLPTPPADMPRYWAIVRRRFWRIAGVAAACTLAAWLISTHLTPVYESTATVDVDRLMPTGILGQEAARPAVNDTDQFLATQAKLIQSDPVVRPAAQRLGLATPLKELRVTRPPNTYLLLISYRSSNAQRAAEVANGVARSYLEQTYAWRAHSSAALAAFMEKHLDELKAKMERSSAALARFEQELNVVDPEQKAGILSARLLQLNSEYTNAQIDRVRKQGAWQAAAAGTLEAAQVSTQGEALKKLLERRDAVREKFAEVKAHYGANHPEFHKAAAQVAEVESQLRQAVQSAMRRVELEYRESLQHEIMLHHAVAEAKAEFDRLNARSFEYQALKRDAEADRKLYDDLERKIREAGINAGFENSSIRIAGVAVPAARPVSPDPLLNAALALLFSSLMAVSAAVLAERLDRSLRHPGQIAALFQTEALGCLPRVKAWRRRAAHSAAHPPPPEFEEAVRSLRNSIRLGAFDRPVKSVLLTSALASEGKSTAALHLAMAHAQRQERTLLIDADLRRSSLCGRLGLHPENGLAAALHNGLRWRDHLVKLVELPDLDILPAGRDPGTSPDLLGARLPRILREAASAYDLIVIDAPPVLGFSEPLEMAAAADGVVLVARAGVTSQENVRAALDILRRVHARVLGVVLNQVTSPDPPSYVSLPPAEHFVSHPPRSASASLSSC
jgi:polysaccharide biosynthesis transport protein